ncbi:hypothetical protein K491DRAFT_351260 [Lophiostoma macrostomum CBS 122681]|uniref:Uncharacterized protein n=1 Tax=Lophiostoma macrostomum CBS 122681 TaxID=1314788 RepID=A0A6A6TB40_9PLEO|nr:hypothetical protein K491DRAFT_351260 [Lophiostoma macrostomum CBS 122681]
MFKNEQPTNPPMVRQRKGPISFDVASSFAASWSATHIRLFQARGTKIYTKSLCCFYPKHPGSHTKPLLSSYVVPGLAMSHCEDYINIYTICRHQRLEYGRFGTHLYQQLNRINSPWEVSRPGLPFEACRPRRRWVAGFCPSCVQENQRMGWTFGGYAGGAPR